MTRVVSSCHLWFVKCKNDNGSNSKMKLRANICHLENNMHSLRIPLWQVCVVKHIN